MVPRQFCEFYVRVWSKSEAKMPLVKALYKRWCESTGGHDTPVTPVPLEQPQSALEVAAEMELMMGDGDDGAVLAAAPTEGSGLAAAVSEGEEARVAPLTPPHPGQKGTEEPESKRQRTN